MITDELLKKHRIVSEQVDARELRMLLLELETLLKAGVHGNVVELGCYVGTTSLFIRRLLNAYQFSGEFHVYDSFSGLPPKTSKDMSEAGAQFVTGELLASRKTLIEHFKKAGLQLPIIHKCWFNELQESDIPKEVFFAFFDGDYYESIRDSFRVVAPHLAGRAVIVVDDYISDALPGAARATNEWAESRDAKVQGQSSLGIIRLS